MAKGTLVVTCGLPGSGKTTFVRQLVEKFNPIVISEDDLVTTLHGGKYTNYDPALKDMYHSLEALALIFALAARQRLIVVDRCCPKAATRARFADMAYNEGYSPVLAFFDPDEMTDEERVSRRMLGGGRGHSAEKWTEVIQKMRSGFERPNILEESFHLIAPPEVVLDRLTAKAEAGLLPAGDQ